MTKNILRKIVNLLPPEKRNNASRILSVADKTNCDIYIKLVALHDWLELRPHYAELRAVVGDCLYGSDRHAAN